MGRGSYLGGSTIVYASPSNGVNGLSGQSLTNQMTSYMEEICGKKHGNKQSKPEPSHHPFWRVTDFKLVEAAVIKYASYRK